VIPVTWRETILQYLRAGDKVNIEGDLIVKTIKARLERMLGDEGAKGSLTIDKLREMGF
jgi:riboflavin synthase alpha subunit